MVRFARSLFGALMLCFISSGFAQSLSPTLKVLFSFPCTVNPQIDCPYGLAPTRLMESVDGNFYGTTANYGTGLNAQGTVFKMSRSGTVTVLYNFAELPDGSLPYGSSPERIIEGTDGLLYGTAGFNGPYGVGTIFTLNKTTGAISDLHNFCMKTLCTDGAYPSDLLQALDGNFYGSTGPSGYPADVLYRVSPSGTFAVLHTYDSKSQPDGGGAFQPFQAANGDLYGATVAGGQNTPFNSVFRFNPSSKAYTILHPFDWPNIAESNLVQASSGELFGLQTNSILYQISSSGSGYRQVAALSATQFSDGGILQASDGNLWGTFYGGQCAGQGIVFAATTAGHVLHTIVFDCNVDGQHPISMFQASDGKFYGVTFGYGSASTNSVWNGTIWELDAGLPPPKPSIVAFSPTAGGAGTVVLLQGAHFIGTTTVSFNGINASYTVPTSGFIRATVPAGAKTGKITITNAGGATTSTQSFTVP